MDSSRQESGWMHLPNWQMLLATGPLQPVFQAPVLVWSDKISSTAPHPRPDDHNLALTHTHHHQDKITIHSTLVDLQGPVLPSPCPSASPNQLTHPGPSLFLLVHPSSSSCRAKPSTHPKKNMSLLRIATRGPAASFFRATTVRPAVARPLAAVARPTFSSSSRLRSEHQEESFEEFSAR